MAIEFNKVLSTLGQLTAVAVAMSFVMGLQTQSAFYQGLGLGWLNDYLSYLDAIKGGMGNTKVFLLTFFSAFLMCDFLVPTKKGAEICLFLVFISGMLVLSSDLIPNLLYHIASLEYLKARSTIQLVAPAFLAGSSFSIFFGFSMLGNVRRALPPANHNENDAFTKRCLMVMLYMAIGIGVMEAPNSAGSANARAAIATSFAQFPIARSNVDASEKWRVIGSSQGNLILLRMTAHRNGFETKIANDLSQWTIDASPDSSVILPTQLF